MAGIYGNTLRLGGRRIVFPCAVFLEPVAEDAAHEIPDTRKLSAALPLADDMLGSPDADHFDTAERPVDAVRAVVGISLMYT